MLQFFPQHDIFNCPGILFIFLLNQVYSIIDFCLPQNYYIILCDGYMFLCMYHLHASAFVHSVAN